MPQAQESVVHNRRAFRILRPLRAGQRTLLAYLLLVGVIVVDVAFLYQYGRTILDSDMASEMVLANLLNQTGEFIAKGWIYRNELRILSITQLYRIGLLLFPNNWLYARVLSQLLAQCLLAGSMIYCLRGAQMSHARSALGASLLCAPITFWSINLIGFGGYYLVYIAAVLVSLGLLLRMVDSHGARAVVQWVCLGVLSLLGGLNGVRLLMCYQGPLFLSALVLFYTHLREKALGRLAAEEYRRARRYLLIATTCLFAGLVGYYINTHVFPAFYVFGDYSENEISDFSLAKLLAIFSKLIVLFGYQQTAFEVDDALLSFTGLGSIAGLLTSGIGCFCVYACIKQRRFLVFRHKVPIVFLLSSVLVCTLIFTLSPDYKVNESYWLPVLPAAFVSLCIGLSVWKSHSSPRIWRSLCLLLAVCITASSCSALYQYIHKPLRGNPQRVEVANWLVDHQYQQGYASFWNGNVITELSNNSLEIWTLPTDNLTEPALFPSLQQKRHYEGYPSAERLFYVAYATLPLKEDSFIYKYYTDVKVEYTDPSFVVYTFSNPHLLPE